MTRIGNAIENRITNKIVSMLTWISVFLLFVGEVRIPIGGSELYTPLAIFPAIILFVIRLGLFDLHLLRGALALLGVLIAGVLSTVWSDHVSVARSVAAMFPIAIAALVLLAFNGVRGLSCLIVSAVIAGGSILAVWVILLSIQASISGLPFYEAKLLIETPLGRSNYLAAFLLAFLAFSWGRSLKLRGLALIAFGAISIYSRGAFLVFLLFICIVFLRSFRSRYKKYFLGAVFVFSWFGILATISSEVLFQSDLSENFGFDPFESAENRLLLWKASLDMLGESPLFGVGPNGFRSFVERSGLEDVWGPHNSVLLLWLNYGVLGVFFYFAYCFFIFRSVRNCGCAKMSDNNVLVLLCLLLVFSLFEPLVGSASFELLLAIIYIWSVNFQTGHGARMLRSSCAARYPQ